MLPELRIGRVRVAPPLALAPMSGWADPAFRAEVRRLGGTGLAFSEMISPRKLLEGSAETELLLAAADRPLAVQLYGAEERRLVEAARRLADRGARIVDLNLGCPARKVARKGGGAALLRDPARAARLAGRVVAALRVPVTAKLRLGPAAGEAAGAPELARLLVAEGLAALTVHGRTADQLHSGPVDAAGLARTVEAVAGRVPVLANGGVEGAASARRLLAATGADGLAVGQAALRDPWTLRRLADELYGKRFRPPTRAARADFALRHFRRLAALRGEESACRQFRKWAGFYGPALGLDAARTAALRRLERAADLAAALGGLASAPGRA